jgi:hypothetical protein
MKKITIICAMILCFFVAKSQEKNAYVFLSGGGGLGGFQYDLYNLNSDGSTATKLSGSGTLGFSYFFHKHWGVSIGAGLSYRTSEGKLDAPLQKDVYYNLGTQTDNTSDNPVGNGKDQFELRARLTDWKEIQQAYFADIPLSIVYEYRFGETHRHGLYAALGGKMQIPVQSKFKVSDGKYPQDARLNVSGFYRNDGNLELGAPGDPDLSRHGFGTIINPNETLGWNGKIKLKNSYAVTADLGVLVGLSEQFDLTLGIFADYGLNDIKTKGNQPLMQMNGNYLPAAEQHVGKGISYSGMLNSNSSSDVKLWSVGLKAGLRFNVGKAGK